MMLLIHTELALYAAPGHCHVIFSQTLQIFKLMYIQPGPWPLIGKLKEKKRKLNICPTIPTLPKTQSGQGQDGQPGVKENVWQKILY